MNDEWFSGGDRPRHGRRAGRGGPPNIGAWWNGAPWAGPAGQGPGIQGPPAWLAEMLGFTPPAPPPNRGPRVRRGDVRVAIIDVLHRAVQNDEAINGYQVIQQITDLSDGEWRPSPGSVYPTISQLEDEGLVESDDERGRRTIRLSAAGVAWAEGHTEELAAVWAPFARRNASTSNASDHDSPGADVTREIGQVLSAVWQLVTQGSEAQRKAALDVLVTTRRNLYGILADGDGKAES